MKHLIVFFGVSLALFTACKQDSGSKGASDAQKEKLTELAGHWVCIDFCSRASQYGSVLAAMNNGHKPYAYAVTFNPAFPDSAECFNGMEEWKVATRINVDTVELKGARQNNQSIFLVMEAQGKDKQLTMFDPSPNGMQMDRFIKSKAGASSGYANFLAALNHNLFSGVFTQVGNPKSSKNIQFTPGGFIMELGDYDRYELCTAGDCFFLGPNEDVITLRKSQKENSEKPFMFKYSNQNDTLRLFEMINVNPEDKFAYKLGKQAYVFARKKVD